MSEKEDTLDQIKYVKDNFKDLYLPLIAGLAQGSCPDRIGDIKSILFVQDGAHIGECKYANYELSACQPCWIKSLNKHWDKESKDE